MYIILITKSETEHNVSLAGNYYKFYSMPALLNHKKDREIGTVMAESKAKLIIVDDEITREHVYLIPKTKVDRYGDKKVYLDVSENSLKQFEFF
jgi:hypothetical protein